METIDKLPPEIREDPELIDAIKDSLMDIQSGRVMTLDEYKSPDMRKNAKPSMGSSVSDAAAECKDVFDELVDAVIEWMEEKKGTWKF